MGTKKGQKRSTARRAYKKTTTPKKRKRGEWRFWSFGEAGAHLRIARTRKAAREMRKWFE